MQHVALVVDDDEDVLLFFEYFLSRYDIPLLKAADGQEALTLLNEHQPLIIFLDLLLPKVDGLAVLAFIRTAAHLQNSYVVIVTSQSPINPVDADAYLVKPLRVKQLEKLLASIHKR